jgi:hypothetical protein
MNAKRWFAWVCLALMLVAEIMLYHANHERDAALDALHKAQLELSDANAKLGDSANSTPGEQTSLVGFLKAQNAGLVAKVSLLQSNLDRLEAESQETAAHLTRARDAIQLQQASMQQLQVQQQQATMVANANACINNLHMIATAKTQWALDKQKSTSDVPTVQDLQPYFKDGILPVCPDGGTYSINAVGEAPTCSVPGHVLPP